MYPRSQWGSGQSQCQGRAVWFQTTFPCALEQRADLGATDAIKGLASWAPTPGGHCGFRVLGYHPALPICDSDLFGHSKIPFERQAQEEWIRNYFNPPLLNPQQTFLQTSQGIFGQEVAESGDRRPLRLGRQMQGTESAPLSVGTSPRGACLTLLSQEAPPFLPCQCIRLLGTRLHIRAEERTYFLN